MGTGLKRNLVLFACVAAVAGVVAVTAFGVPIRSVLVFGMIALCPLMHLFMGHGAHGGSEHAHHEAPKSAEEAEAHASHDA